MTPEERARGVLSEFYGDPDTGDPYLSSLIADAIRAAVAEERERCAGICERVAWSNANTPILGPEQNAIKCANVIRKKRH